MQAVDRALPGSSLDFRRGTGSYGSTAVPRQGVISRRQLNAQGELSPPELAGSRHETTKRANMGSQCH